MNVVTVMTAFIIRALFEMEFSKERRLTVLTACTVVSQQRQQQVPTPENNKTSEGSGGERKANGA